MTYDTAYPIGSGGMGEVFKAWDPELGRWVALKYLRHDDPELVERLLREARAQARVDHPGVCQVYAVGEEDCRPYIAMQYVEGRHLDEAAEHMTLEQKVLAVKQVAEAVQAAHAVGLIHRDLKPSNIMVAEGPDGGLRPYVLDFGIARELEVAGLTVSGQVLGTPGYLSPEQALGQTAMLDRRTDIFSLGVILYELLSGKKPFPGDSSVEVLVKLIEDEAVPLSRHLRHVPRDLETVVMRCLEKAPERRYPSARALAEELGRFLAGEPVLARPVSRAERLLRLARKHRLTAALAVASALLAFGLLTALIGGWAKYTVDLKRERDVAEQNEREAKEVTGFLVSVFEGADPDKARGDTVTARELLDSGAERISSEFADRPLTRAHLMQVMGEINWKLGLYPRAEELLTGSLAIREAELEADHLDVAAGLSSLGVLYSSLDRLDQAEAILRRVIAIREKALGPDHPDVASALNNLGLVLQQQGRYAEAVEVTSRALEIKRRALGTEHRAVGAGYHNLGMLQQRLGRLEEAEATYRLALEIKERTQGPDHPSVAVTLMNLGATLHDLGRYDEAEDVLRRAVALEEKLVGPKHPLYARALNNLGRVLRGLGRREEAVTMALQALAVREEALGPTHPDVATSYQTLGQLYVEQGLPDKAERSFLRAIEVHELAGGSDHPNLSFSLLGLGEVRLEQHRLSEAKAVLERALAIWKPAHGSDWPTLIPTLRRLAQVELELGNPSVAEPLLQRALTLSEQTRGRDHETTVAIRQSLDELRSE